MEYNLLDIRYNIHGRPLIIFNLDEQIKFRMYILDFKHL